MGYPMTLSTTSNSDSVTIEDLPELQPDTTSTDLSILARISGDVLKELEIAHHKAPEQKDKKRSTLKIGLLALEARRKFDSDKEYGAWCKSDIFNKCPTSLKPISTKTLNRYKKLAEFSDHLDGFEEKLKLCLEVGFTNAYTLMGGSQTVNELWNGLREGTIKPSEIDSKLNPDKLTKQKKQRFTQLKADVNDLTTEQKQELIELLTESVQAA